MSDAQVAYWNYQILDLGYTINDVERQITPLGPLSPDGDQRAEVSVRLRPGVGGTVADQLKLLACALRISIVELAPGDVSPNARFSVYVERLNRSRALTNEHGRALFAWDELNVHDITRGIRVFDSDQSQNITVWDITFRAAIYYTPDAGGFDALHAFGKRKRDHTIDPKSGFCGCQALVIGMESIRVGEQQCGIKRERRANLRLQKARELHAKLGLDTDGGMTHPDFAKFVSHPDYTQYRVSVWINYHGCFRPRDRHDYTGATWSRTCVDARYANTIHVAFYEKEQHFDYLGEQQSGMLAALRERDHAKRCQYCSGIFPTYTPALKKAWMTHKCCGLEACPACYKRTDSLLRHLKNGHPCDVCGTICGDAECEDAHTQMCIDENAERYRNHCMECERPHPPGTPCNAITCVGSCRRKLSPQDIPDHICFMAKAKRDRTNREQLEDEDASDEELAYADHLAMHEDDMPLESTKLDHTWAADLEAFQRVVVKKQAPLKFTRSKFRGEILEHVPVIIGAVNVGTGERKIWTVRDCQNPLMEFIGFFVGARTRNSRNSKVPPGKRSPKQIVYFHNGGRYDMQHLYNTIVSEFGMSAFRKSKNSGVIMDGALIKKMDCGRTVFLDSMLHLKYPLAKLPKILSLDIEDSKMNFPYKFARMGPGYEDRIDYAGPLPSLDEFEADRKRGTARQELEEWHAAETARVNADLAAGGKGWVLWDEYLKYFQPDLDILAAALGKYSQLMIEAGFNDPIGEITLPSNCLKSFIARYMQRDSIPLLKMYPRFCQPWEFNAYDEYKACNASYRGGMTGNYQLQYHLSPDQIAAGWRLEMLDFVSMYPSVMVNKPYPTGKYDWHDFQWDVQPEYEDYRDKEGVLCCEIEPTRAVRFPPLHRIINGKLTFSLLPSLSEEDAMHFHRYFWNRERNSAKPCAPTCDTCKRLRYHEPPVYTMPEIREAVERYGFKIRHVYFAMLAYESRTDLWNAYYAKAFGTKCKYAKPPKFNWGDPAVCKWYVDNMREKACIEIPPEFHAHPQDWHEPNDALKEMGKLCANSFYGKLSAKAIMDEVHLVENDPVKEQEYAEGRHGQVVGAPTDHAAGTAFRLRANRPGEGFKQTNVLMGAYVTAYARLKICRVMNEIHDSGGIVCYGDTDSVLAVLPPGVPMPATGPFLGDLESDIKPHMGTPCGYVGLLPKTYAIVNTEGELIKMRFKGVSGLGVGGDARNASLVDWWLKFKEIADKMMEGEGGGTVVHHRIIRWNRHCATPSIQWQDGYKLAKADVEMLKGVLANDGGIYPLGAERFDWPDRQLEWIYSKGRYVHQD